MDYIATFTDGHTASTLSHYGITGMKWYRRRFQNPDGSLTAEGRARYLKNADRASMYRQKASDASLKSEKYSYKKDKIASRRVQTDLSIDRANRASVKASRANLKAAKYERKASRLDKANADLTTPVEWSEKQIQKRRLKELNKKRTESEDSLSKSVYDNPGTYKKLFEIDKELDAGYMRSGHGEELAINLASRFNERFDPKSGLDSVMKKHFESYNNGKMSEKELSRVYDIELNNYSKKVVTSLSKDELSHIARSFYKDNDPELDSPDNLPKNTFKAYMQRLSILSEEASDFDKLDKLESKDSFTYTWKNPKQTVKKLYNSGYSIGEIVADLPDELNKDGKGEQYVRNVLGSSNSKNAQRTVGTTAKSSGRYRVGSRPETASRGSMIDIVSQDKTNWRMTSSKKGERGFEYIGKGGSPEAQVKSLRNAGYTYREIEQVLGISSSKIAKILS